MNENAIADQDGVMNMLSSFYSAEDNVCENAFLSLVGVGSAFIIKIFQL